MKKNFEKRNEKIIELRKMGKTNREIGVLFGLTAGAISTVCSRLRYPEIIEAERPTTDRFIPDAVAYASTLANRNMEPAKWNALYHQEMDRLSAAAGMRVL